MPVLPAKVLQLNVTNVTTVGVWLEDDGTGDPFIGFPWQWEVTADVTVQPHSSYITPTPYQYDGNDVKVGDWIANRDPGMAWRIYQIVSQNPSTIVIRVEDVDRYVLFSDSSQSGTADPGATSSTLLFSLSDSGNAILSPVQSGIFATELLTGLQSRFTYRNAIASYQLINQASHGLSVGDQIYMDNSGAYVKAQANGSNAQQVVGTVNTVNTPGPDWFTYRPVGEIIEDPTITFPGNSGDLIYLSTSTPGALTATMPTAWSKPVYIRLENANKAIKVDRNIDAIQPTRGYSSQIYQVADIPARDALTNLNIGDQAYVVDTGEGEWTLFSWVGSWVQIATQDSSTVDAETEATIVNFDSTSPIAIHRVSPTRRITTVSVEILTPWNDNTATLTVGDINDNSRLMDSNSNDLTATVNPIFVSTPVYQYTGVTETEIYAYISSGTATQGQARVSITYT